VKSIGGRKAQLSDICLLSIHLHLKMLYFLVYRKCKNSPNSQWHFNTRSPRWPEVDFIQVRFVEVKAGERLCQECAKLESEMSPE
jgi:hypothetical protein